MLMIVSLLPFSSLFLFKWCRRNTALLLKRNGMRLNLDIPGYDAGQVSFFFSFFFKMTFKNPEMHIGETIEMKGFQPGLSDLTLLKIVLVVWQANCWTLLWQYQHWLLVHSGHVRSQGLYINGNWLKKTTKTIRLCVPLCFHSVSY